MFGDVTINTVMKILSKLKNICGIVVIPILHIARNIFDTTQSKAKLIQS